MIPVNGLRYNGNQVPRSTGRLSPTNTVRDCTLIRRYSRLLVRLPDDAPGTVRPARIPDTLRNAPRAIVGAMAGIPVWLAPSRLATRHVPVLALPGEGFRIRDDAPADSGSIPEDAPGSATFDCGRGGRIPVLARCRPVPRHVDARSASTARHGTGTLRGSGGCASEPIRLAIRMAISLPIRLAIRLIGKPSRIGSRVRADVRGCARMPFNHDHPVG